MLILADENIPFVQEAFAMLGEVRTLPGRQISRRALGRAEVLLVRSVTDVNEGLLSETKIRFVGTATIGVDHVDVDWLNANGIGFSSAPGSNAESVAQYVAAVLCRFREIFSRELRWRTIGIVGVGQCGSRVLRMTRAFDLDPWLCDPPLARATHNAHFRPLSDLQDCDFMTIHVPLTEDGSDPTVNLVNSAFLEYMKPGFVMINAARGGVVNEMALLRAAATKRLGGAALDVWTGEPRIDIDLLKTVNVATPHIAGYSLDGKIRATEMLHTALCRFLGEEPCWTAASVLPPLTQTIEINPNAEPHESLLARLILDSYPIMRDDAELRKILSLPLSHHEEHFDSIRKNYPVRREFSATKIVLNPFDADLARRIHDVGFTIAEEPKAGFQD